DGVTVRAGDGAGVRDRQVGALHAGAIRSVRVAVARPAGPAGDGARVAQRAAAREDDPGAPVAAAEKGRPAGAAGDRAGVGQRPATGEVHAVPTRARRAGIAVGAAAATAAATAAQDRHARGVRVADPDPVHDGAVAAGATTTARTNVAGCIAPATAVPAGDHDRLRGVRRDDRAVRASTAT